MTQRMTRHLLQAALVASSLASPMARADGGVDTVYHPYVQPLEQELELRLGHEHDTDRRDIETWRLGYGRSVSERVFVEGYLIGQGRRPDALSLAGYELEALWQLTEQGRYAADWALLAELERGHDSDHQSGMVSLIGERQWGRLVGTLNAGIGYEWGADVRDEAETRLALQARYRYSPRLEPALEFYAGEKLRALGPALLGTERLSPGRRLHWEAGLALGLDHASPDLSLRSRLEYEF